MLALAVSEGRQERSVPPRLGSGDLPRGKRTMVGICAEALRSRNGNGNVRFAGASRCRASAESTYRVQTRYRCFALGTAIANISGQVTVRRMLRTPGSSGAALNPRALVANERWCGGSIGLARTRRASPASRRGRGLIGQVPGPVGQTRRRAWRPALDNADKRAIAITADIRCHPR